MNEHESHDWSAKLKSGEYIHTWNGFSPYYAGCYYGHSLRLGGEDNYKHCYDFFMGVGYVEWWIVDELEKLTREEKDLLLYMLERNKKFDEFKKSITKELAKVLGVEPYQIYRTRNRDLYDFINVVQGSSEYPFKNQPKDSPWREPELMMLAATTFS